MFNAKRFHLEEEAVIDCIILPMETRQDPLTGILNRRAFMEEIHLTLQSAQMEPLMLSA